MQVGNLQYELAPARAADQEILIALAGECRDRADKAVFRLREFERCGSRQARDTLQRDGHDSRSSRLWRAAAGGSLLTGVFQLLAHHDGLSSPAKVLPSAASLASKGAGSHPSGRQPLRN